MGRVPEGPDEGRERQGREQSQGHKYGQGQRADRHEDARSGRDGNYDGGRRRVRSLEREERRDEDERYRVERLARQREASPVVSMVSSPGRSSGRGSPAPRSSPTHEREGERGVRHGSDRDGGGEGRGSPSPSLTRLFPDDERGGARDGEAQRSVGVGGAGLGRSSPDDGARWDQPTATTPAVSSTWSTPKDKRRLSIIELESLGDDAGASYGLVPSRTSPSAASSPSTSPTRLIDDAPTRAEVRGVLRREVLRGR